MADNETSTGNTAKEPTEPLSRPHETWNSLLRLFQVLLPAVGIFTALSYFLGRLHIEAYYYALGITPHVLQFKSEDYMFSSFNLVVMCFAVTVWLYIYWRTSRSGIRLVLGFPVPIGQKWPELLTDILMLISLLGIFGLLSWNIFANKNYGSNTPGLMGLNAGFVIGVGVIIYRSFVQWFIRRKEFTIVGVIVVSLLLLASIPTITNRLAEIEARAAMGKFPIVVLTCEDTLPTQLQISPFRPTQSVEVKLIITNSGMTYVLRQDIESVNEWEVYAIPEDDIKQIMYLRK